MLMNMKDLLAVAREHKFAVPAFNISSNMLLTGVMEASEEMQSPVILAIHPDELSFVGTSFVKMAIDEAHKASVPVCIHLDHGATLEQVMIAIQAGFTSVMIDASLKPLAENIAISKRIVEVAHAVNVSVEGELGTIGTTGPEAEPGADVITYADPNEAEQFVRETGVDTLAVAIGTSHGIYPKDRKPEIKLNILEEIYKRVEIPLVLHGGSANPDSEVAASVKLGICKINISSDIKDAFYQKAREILQHPLIREPNSIYPPCIEAMKEVARYKITLFDAAGKASLYHGAC